MADHARYSPSKLPRIIGCPGSTTVDQETESSIYADEGTQCHDITAGHLEKSEFSLDVNHPGLLKFATEDRIELADAIQDCLNYTFGLITKYSTHPAHMLVESRVSLHGFADILDCKDLADVAGTADLIIMYPTIGELHVIDWKFGKGVEVFPSSEQLLAYGLGALKNPYLMDKYNKVYLHIGQPRLYAGELFKVHETVPADLYDWAALTLVPALLACNELNPEFRPSDKACRWCAIKHNCAARHELALQTAQDVFRIHAELPKIKQPEELASFLERARNLTDYIKDIEGFITRTLRSGGTITGLKMVESRSNRQWVDEKAFFQWAQKNIPDADIFEEPKLVTPSKAEKLVKRKIASSEEFKALIFKPEGKHTLVTEADPREAISYETASDKFAAYKEE